ncbi:hypothetical protein M758_6G007200 [Ceratodon purpureus]|uniref:Uncharacterized protein n=1 Tax=Ceratodon purpureus TaxID=3225 RepID=A0A8T0HA25_CERPU|nr:hypothetical protein KC19_6G009300 [Ceratodon purpureus]KAG0612164.1 hypothetical protein M758_6G007200 [Ceratodon purpureus]
MLAVVWGWFLCGCGMEGVACVEGVSIVTGWLQHRGGKVITWGPMHFECGEN